MQVQCYIQYKKNPNDNFISYNRCWNYKKNFFLILKFYLSFFNNKTIFINKINSLICYNYKNCRLAAIYL